MMIKLEKTSQLMQPWLEEAPKSGEKMNGHLSKSYNTVDQQLGIQIN